MTNRRVLLGGKEVALAEMTADDQPFFQQWLSGNAELRALIDDHRVPNMQDQLNWFKRTQEPDRKMFSLVTVPGGQLIGNCGFVDIDGMQREGTLRITIGHADYLGKGLGSEATRLLVRYGFETMGLERISLKVLKTNARAIRAYEKAGFAVAGDAPEGDATLVMTLDKKALSSALE